MVAKNLFSLFCTTCVQTCFRVASTTVQVCAFLSIGKIFVILVCLILPLPAMLAFIDPDCSKSYKNVFSVKVTLGMGTGW